MIAKRRWKIFLRIVGLLCLMLTTETICVAAGYGILVGPPGIGRGGPNPVGLPPQAIDLQAQFVTRKGFDASLSVIGLYLGRRYEIVPKLYAALGGGVVLSGNGVGLGVYSTVGSAFYCGAICLVAEYQQGLGLGSKLLSPYAVRLGVVWWTD